MSSDPSALEKLQQIRREYDRLYGDRDAESSSVATPEPESQRPEPPMTDSENLVLRLALNAQAHIEQARRLCERLASTPPRDRD